MDIGCGDGSLLYQYRNRYAHLIGLEYSAERLRQAEANLAGLKFTGLQGSAEEIAQLADNSVDRIITADVIEHIPDVYAASHEMFRVLKPGGWLVINTPNIAFIKKRLVLALGRFPSTSQPNEGLGSDVLFDGGHLHYFTYRSLRLVLERAGFEMVRPMGFGRFGIFHSLWPSLTSGGVQWVAKKPA
jgi:SAM-dependent methyltransferase